MATILPSEKLLQQQSQIAKWKQEQEKRRQLLMENPQVIDRQQTIDQREKEYKDYRKKTSAIESKLGFVGWYQAIQKPVESLLGDYAQYVSTPLNLAYIARKPFSAVKKIKRANYERMLEKELGAAGKLSRSLDVISQLGLYTRAYPKALKYLTGGSINIGLPTSPSMYLAKGLAHLIGMPAASTAQTALGKIGLSIAGTMPYMALSMGASMWKAHKLAKIQVQRKPGQQVEREHSLSPSIQAQITRLVSENQLQPKDQLELQLLQWIESHTSVIPVIYEELDLARQSKEKGTKELEKSTETLKQPKDESLLTKIEKVVNTSIIKYDPVSQLINFVTSGKFPKDALQDILGTKDEKERQKFIDSKTKQFGLNRQQFQLLTMDSSQVLNLASTYEAKILAVQSGIYDLMRLSALELTAIRAQGFGIPENLLYTKQVSESKSIFGKFFKFVKELPKRFVELPGINALWNLAKLPFEAPKRVYQWFEDVKDKFKTFVFGKDLTELLKSPQEVLKKAGLYKSDQELAYSFLGKSLPPLMEDFRKIEVEQLEVQQNIYQVLRKQLKHLTGIEVSYEQTQKGLKTGKQWSTTLGRYLSEKDYEERRKMEEKLIKHTIASEFESGSPIGRLLAVLLGGDVEKRFQRVERVVEKFTPSDRYKDYFTPQEATKSLMRKLRGRQTEGFTKTFTEELAKAEGYKTSIFKRFEEKKASLVSGLPVLAGAGMALAFGGPLATFLFPLAGVLSGVGKYGRRYEKIQKKVQPYLTRAEMEKSESFAKTEEELIKESIPKTFEEVQRQTQQYRQKNVSVLENIFDKLKNIYNEILNFKQETVKILSNIYTFLTSTFSGGEKQEQKLSPYKPSNVVGAITREGAVRFDKESVKNVAIALQSDKTLITISKGAKILEEKRKVVGLPESIPVEIEQKVKKLPGLQKGGVVTKESVVRVGEKGRKEAIIPLEDKRSLSIVSKSIGEQIKKPVEKTVKLAKILQFPKSNVRTLKQEIQEVRQQQERKKWNKFRNIVVEYLKDIVEKFKEFPTEKTEKKKKKSIFDSFKNVFKNVKSWLKDILVGSVTFAAGKFLQIFKRGLKGLWNFLKSPKEWIKGVKDKIVNIVTRGKEIGKKIVTRAGEIGTKVKKGIETVKEFIKSPSKVFKVVKEKAVDVVTKGKELGSKVVGKTIEFGKRIVKGAEKVGEFGKSVLDRTGEVGSKIIEAGKTTIPKVKGVIGKSIEIGERIAPKIGSVVGKTLEIGERIAPKALELGGRVLGGAAELGLRTLSTPLTVALSAYDAYKGWTEVGKAFGLKKGQEATLGMKLASATGRVSTLGFSDKKAAQFIYKLFGGKIPEQVQEKKQQEQQPDTEEMKNTAFENMKKFVMKIVNFPLTLYNKFEEFISDKIKLFKDSIGKSFDWIFNLPKTIITAIKERLKDSFVGKFFTSIFNSDDEPNKETKELELHHAASGGLFLKESITHIAEKNKPEVVLPLESPKTHELVQRYFEIYSKKNKKYESTFVKQRENFLKSALDTIETTTSQKLEQQSKPAVVAVPQPVPQPIVTPTQVAVGSDGRQKTDDVQFDFIIEKHLNDIFKNTIIMFEKSIQDYIFGNLAFNVI